MKSWFFCYCFGRVNSCLFYIVMRSSSVSPKISFWKLSVFLFFLFILLQLLPYLPVQPFCLFKKVTGIPCPGCGCTRSLSFLMQGDWRRSWNYNPMVIILVVYFSVVYLFSLYDQIMKTGFSWNLTHFPIGKCGYIFLIFMMLTLWIRNILLGI